VRRNRTRSATFDGIVVDDMSNTSVLENHTEENGGPGIGLYDGASSNFLTNNRVERNSRNFPNTLSCPDCFGGGILLDKASSNTVRANHIRENGTLNGSDNTDGIRVNAPSTDNTIRDNHLRKNRTHDCHDASVGNIWINNRGETSVPPSLCGEDNDDKDEESSSAFGWNSSYAWFASIEGANDPELDWPAAYATVDTESLLQLLPQLQLGRVRTGAVSLKP
jgi:parallel beta-helix repeat protein